MGYPYRMNLTKVKIQQIVTSAAAELDSDFRQPRSGVGFSSTVIVVPAQITMLTFRASSPTRTGDADPSTGYLTIKQRWLDKNSVELQKGDKIIAMATSKNAYRDVAFRINQLLPQGHLPYPALLIARFTYDREERDAL